MSDDRGRPSDGQRIPPEPALKHTTASEDRIAAWLADVSREAWLRDHQAAAPEQQELVG